MRRREFVALLGGAAATAWRERFSGLAVESGGWAVPAIPPLG